MESENRLWFYKTFGTEFGPFTMDELIELAKTHQLSSEDGVKFKVDGKWREAGSIGRLVAHLPYRPAKKLAPVTMAVEKSILSETQAFDQEPPIRRTAPQCPPTQRNQRSIAASKLTVERTADSTKVELPIVELPLVVAKPACELNRPSDASLLHSLSEKIAAKNIQSFQQIEIEVASGVVTVRGGVISEGERLLLIHLLKQVDGVEQIVDGLSIRPGDSDGTMKVRAANFKRPTHQQTASRTPSVLTTAKVAYLSLGLLSVLMIGGVAMVLQASSSTAKFRGVFPEKGRGKVNATSARVKRT